MNTGWNVDSNLINCEFCERATVWWMEADYEIFPVVPSKGIPPEAPASSMGLHFTQYFKFKICASNWNKR